MSVALDREVRKVLDEQDFLEVMTDNNFDDYLIQNLDSDEFANHGSFEWGN